MRQDEGKITRTSAFLAGFLALSIFFIIAYYGLAHFEYRYQQTQLQEFSQDSVRVMDAIKPYTNDEEFWCRTLSEEFSAAKNPGDFHSALVRNRQKSGEKLPCLIWDKQNNIIYNSHFTDARYKEQNLRLMIQDIKELSDGGIDLVDEAKLRLRRMLGPHLSIHKLFSILLLNSLVFIRPDASGNFSHFWIDDDLEYGAMVFFDPDSKDKEVGLRCFLSDFSDGQLKIHLANTTISDYQHEAKNTMLQSFHTLERRGQFAGIANGQMITGKRLSESSTILITKKYEALFRPEKLSALLLLLALFILLLIFRSDNKAFQLNNHSVKWQLILMLFVTTGLPLLTLLMIASDHISQKRNALIKKAYQTCTSFIQHIDHRSLANDATIHNRVNKAISAIKPGLAENFGQQETVNILQQFSKHTITKIRIISSKSTTLLTDIGVQYDNKFVPFSGIGTASKKNIIEMKVFRDIGSYYLSVVNNRPLELDKMSESEILAEMAYQKPFYEIIQNILLANDKIIPLAWGETNQPILMKLISLQNFSQTDYFMVISFDDLRIQHEFIQRQANNLTRNSLGVKFAYSFKNQFYMDGESLENNDKFTRIIEKTGIHPAIEPCFVELAGQNHVFSGIHAQNLQHYSLFAFYPLERIDKQINEEKRFLFSAGIFALIMLTGLALFFSSNVILPLAALQRGAMAIRQRDYSFKLESLSNDEFGEMGHIFNSSIADFEELSLASIVQNRLLPQHGIKEQEFDLYGKSVPMAELGGDYFDYFRIDEEHYAILMGDVAGHGIGASLIMAMAKAGIMQCNAQLSDPASVLARMHQMILETRTRAQRKVMTFQFLYYNKTNGSAVYANAGGCSPILVDFNRGKTLEITIAGPVLGGFKKSSFSNLEVNIEEGQALVFYTDGIIETMNPAGQEIGYEGFKEMLLDCYDLNARQYYANIFSRYQNWLGDNQAQDDLTILILLRENALAKA